MKPPLAALAVAALVAVGCQKEPAPVAAKPPAAAPLPQPTPTPAPVVATLEPYLVAFDPTPRSAAPLPLGGRIETGPITPLPGIAPLAPAPPTQTVPIPPKTVAPRANPGPTPKTAIPPAVVRLFEDERARTVDDARRRLAAAAARAGQTAAEAKRQWGFVKEGFVAQKQAERADDAAKDADAERADAQKALDEAQQRQRDARRDLQAAYARVDLAPAALERPLPAYRPLPFTYRLALLGEPPASVTVENGTLGRALPPNPGEGGAWIVRCADPARLRVRVGAREGAVVLHPLPAPTPPKPTV